MVVWLFDWLWCSQSEHWKMGRPIRDLRKCIQIFDWLWFHPIKVFGNGPIRKSGILASGIRLILYCISCSNVIGSLDWTVWIAVWGPSGNWTGFGSWQGTRISLRDWCSSTEWGPLDCFFFPGGPMNAVIPASLLSVWYRSDQKFTKDTHNSPSQVSYSVCRAFFFSRKIFTMLSDGLAVFKFL